MEALRLIEVADLELQRQLAARLVAGRPHQHHLWCARLLTLDTKVNLLAPETYLGKARCRQNRHGSGK